MNDPIQERIEELIDCFGIVSFNHGFLCGQQGKFDDATKEKTRRVELEAELLAAIAAAKAVPAPRPLAPGSLIDRIDRDGVEWTRTDRVRAMLAAPAHRGDAVAELEKIRGWHGQQTWHLDSLAVYLRDRLAALRAEPKPPEPPSEPEPSLVQCAYDDPDVIPKIIEAVDDLDTRLRESLRERDEALRKLKAEEDACDRDRRKWQDAMNEAREKLAAAEDVIADRGIPERDCTASLPERIDAIIVQMQNAHHDYGTVCLENEKLTKERDEGREKLADLERDLASFRETHTRILDALGCPNLFAGDETLVSEIKRLKAFSRAAGAMPPNAPE